MSIKEQLVFDHSSELEINPFEYGFNIGFALTTRNKTLFDNTLVQHKKNSGNALVNFVDYVEITDQYNYFLPPYLDPAYGRLVAKIATFD